MKKLFRFFLGTVLVLALVSLFPQVRSFVLSNLGTFKSDSKDFLETVLPSKVFNPEPLTFFGNSFSSKLTQEGVLLSTNGEREKEGLGPLVLNSQLNIAAKHKVEDMFTQQYFEHVSPKGVAAADLARNAGYAYIVIGENLALGNFKDDKELVDAWMASPGHRENILTARYLDIGIAVKQGEYEGRTVWLAVQTFGTPASSCPLLNIALKQEIENNKKELASLEIQLETKREEINSMNPKRGKTYEQKALEYNETVSEYNALVTKLKESIAEYNKEVSDYNNCAQGK